MTLLLTGVAVLAGIAVQIQAQPPTDSRPQEPKTKLEAFLETSAGEIVMKDFYRIPWAPRNIGPLSIEIDAVVLSKVGDDRRLRGIRIQVSEGVHSRASFLDIEEIDSLSKGLAYMVDVAAKWKGTEREPYSELTFATKGDFRIGFYQKGDNQRGFVSSGIIGAAAANFHINDLPKIKDSIDRAADLLKSK